MNHKISKLKIDDFKAINDSFGCENHKFGCNKVFKTFEEKRIHHLVCNYKSDSITMCSNCHIDMKRCDIETHNCESELRLLFLNLSRTVDKLELNIKQQSLYLDDLKVQLSKLKFPNEMEAKSNGSLAKTPVDSNKTLQLNLSKIKEFSETTNSPVLGATPMILKYSKSIGTDEPDKPEFDMYGSPKYKYLWQLSREAKQLEEQKSAEGVAQKNKQKLIDVINQNNNGYKSSLVKMRSWSGRNDDNYQFNSTNLCHIID